MAIHRQQLAENNLSLTENKIQTLKAKPKLKNALYFLSYFLNILKTSVVYRTLTHSALLQPKIQIQNSNIFVQLDHL